MKKELKKIASGFILGILFLWGGTAVCADSTTNAPGGPPTGMPGGGGMESILEAAVTDQVITQDTADKIKAYVQDQQEARKEEMEKMQSLSEEERQKYSEEHKKENNLFATLVQEGILTQSQADTLLKMMPVPSGQGPGGIKQPQSNAGNTEIKVVINGSPKSFSPAPVNKDGSVLVPMRSFFEALRCQVTWDEATKTAVGTKNDTVVKLTINKNSAYVNNQIKSLTTAAQVINGSTFIPLRFVGEALGAEIKWENGTITISQE
ncbi:copper amine oxidase N-terminal domain-containing protein [Candidatus Formimonas warabiya]|uniref:Copper amine oxidase-like N-terminal domain-containing protein n=1 Tax=Formimonas warabiya TaxID=1761012 RepID=A0A3G1KUD8_FORW1|nr:copper amine oxidase N-terminal domain-containing protein [Candidatus Formimonas warabiya]ATW26056.1 hypothetical protein DCMF_15885 [Candidatus Formimonas warabiya]